MFTSYKAKLTNHIIKVFLKILQEGLFSITITNATYTSFKTLWKWVYVEECPDKTSALKREKALKKYSHSQVLILINSSKNIVHQFK